MLLTRARPGLEGAPRAKRGSGGGGVGGRTPASEAALASEVPGPRPAFGALPAPCSRRTAGLRVPAGPAGGARASEDRANVGSR